MFESSNIASFPITPPPGWGFSLPVVYLVWAVVVALCIHYAAGSRVCASVAAIDG